MKKIKVALIGYGLSGSVFHGPLIKCHPGFEMAYILARDGVKIANAQSDFPQAKVISDEMLILNDPDVALAVICTPNVQHYDLAKRALESGKHAVVEKPYTVTAAKGLELASLANSKGLKLAVYQNRRYDGDFKTVQQLIQSGVLGRLVSFESHFDRFRPTLKEEAWREKALPGSGVLYDLGSHLIDQALALFGMPLELYADLAAERLGEVDDAFEIILYYDQLKVTLKASSLIKEPTPRFALYGTKGSFVKYGLDPQENALKEGRLPTTPDWGFEDPAFYGRLNTETSQELIPTLPGSYPYFYRELHRAITEGADVPITATEGAGVIQLIEAAIQSSQTKARVSISKR